MFNKHIFKTFFYVKKQKNKTPDYPAKMAAVNIPEKKASARDKNERHLASRARIFSKRQNQSNSQKKISRNRIITYNSMKTIGPKKKLIKLQPKEMVLESENKIVPELRISGLWLKSNGFNEGEHVEITYGYEYMVIYPLKNKAS